MSTWMAAVRSVLHLLVMAITVVPWALFVIVVSPLVSAKRLWWR